eukprot:TRINITY_DN42484_c0_g1_i1.p2 TRINITY_DN42484_c0_g1~~TRINITY_DN42484_c0_g1_i1.p2  ORF type:complete len:376 (+),score=117.58 TRINITY_DN42484_c0_g1_i1:68-1195(+)
MRAPAAARRALRAALRPAPAAGRSQPRAPAGGGSWAPAQRGAPGGAGQRAVLLAAAPQRRWGSAAAGNEPERVAVERRGDIAVVSLNRGSKYNALDMPMFRAIAQTADRLRTEEKLRAVILRGEGKAFCAGLDVKSVANPLAGAAGNVQELLRRPEGKVSNLAQDVGYLWRLIPCPVIAVTHGVCFGGGFQIALGADMRISHPDCRFSIMEAKWGLVPDMSGTVTLRDLVPKDVAMELAMTARIFKADEALRLGLVTRLADDPLQEAERLAKEIAARSPDSTAAAKRLLHSAWAASEQRALHLETEIQRHLLGGWNSAAAAAKALGVPSLVRPGYRPRWKGWEEEEEGLAREMEKVFRGEYDGVFRAEEGGEQGG